MGYLIVFVLGILFDRSFLWARKNPDKVRTCISRTKGKIAEWRAKK